MLLSTETSCSPPAISYLCAEGQKACEARLGQTALPSPQRAQLHTSLRVALQAAFVFSVILARSSLHDALMGLEWVFGRKQWHLSTLLHQDSSSEAGTWSRVSTPWLARLLMALFVSAGWVQLDSSRTLLLNQSLQTKLSSSVSQNKTDFHICRRARKKH